MDKLVVEKDAKKYKKLFERYFVMDFVFKENGKSWRLVEYGKYTNYDKASGFAIFPEEPMNLDEKKYIIGNFATFFGGLLRIRNIVKPRIEVTEEITITLDRMNLLLERWADNQEKQIMARDFKEFSEFILWCQREKNEKFQIAVEIEKEALRTYAFTEQDSRQLLKVLPHFDVIIYLQVKRQQEQLDANRKLMKLIEGEKGNLSKSDFVYVRKILDAYCCKEAEDNFRRTLEKEYSSSWGELPTSMESYDELLESSIQIYSNRNSEDLKFNMKILRN